LLLHEALGGAKATARSLRPLSQPAGRLSENVRSTHADQDMAKEQKESPMNPVVIVYWRDIPAQVIVGKGRRGTKIPLSERFEQAIDRCAMKVGAKDADAYLAEWRKSDPVDVAGEPEEVARAEAARLEADYDAARLKALIANDGWDARA
jgi:hypothetical protein